MADENILETPSDAHSTPTIRPLIRPSTMTIQSSNFSRHSLSIVGDHGKLCLSVFFNHFSLDINWVYGIEGVDGPGRHAQLSTYKQHSGN